MRRWIGVVVGAILVGIFASLWIVRPADLRSKIIREHFQFKRTSSSEGKTLYSLSESESNRFDNLLFQEGFSCTIYDGPVSSSSKFTRDTKYFFVIPRHEEISTYFAADPHDVGYRFSPEFDLP